MPWTTSISGSAEAPLTMATPSFDWAPTVVVDKTTATAITSGTIAQEKRIFPATKKKGHRATLFFPLLPSLSFPLVPFPPYIVILWRCVLATPKGRRNGREEEEGRGKGKDWFSSSFSLLFCAQETGCASSPPSPARVCRGTQ